MYIHEIIKTHLTNINDEITWQNIERITLWYIHIINTCVCV